MTDTPAATVGATVRAEMARHRISQAVVAKHLHLSQAAVSRRLNGVVPFNVAELDVIARLVNVPVERLVSLEVAA